MKNSHTCPKCAGTKLWKVDPLRTVYEYAPGTIPIHMSYKQANEGGWFSSPDKVGSFVAYVCAACGYSELWAQDFENLRADPEQGIRQVDGPKGQKQGYR